MGIREQTKKETREKLLTVAKAQFINNGLLNISTVEIAKQAGVAHGTVFFHFQNKENLLVEMLDRELLKITDDLYVALHDSNQFEQLLTIYLDYLEREETFFAIIARETPLYAPELRRTILGREAAIRTYFYQALEKEIAQGQYKNLNITVTLNFLFGTLNYYLSLRESFVEQGSVISEKRKIITETFMQFIS